MGREKERERAREYGNTSNITPTAPPLEVSRDLVKGDTSLAVQSNHLETDRRVDTMARKSNLLQGLETRKTMLGLTIILGLDPDGQTEMDEGRKRY